MPDMSRGKCSKNYYTTNSVVLHGALVCCGGLGQPRCDQYKICLLDNGVKLSKTGIRIKVKKEQS